MSVNYNPNKNSIKIWPYQDDMTQAIINYRDIRLSKERNTIVNLDLSGIKRICSSGAVILLHKIISSLSGKKRMYRPIMPEDEKVSQFLQDSGVMSILSSNLDFVSQDLFESVEISKAHKTYTETDNHNIKISSPIYQLTYNNSDDREQVNDIANNMVDLLMDSNIPQEYFKINIFISVITEILKKRSRSYGT